MTVRAFLLGVVATSLASWGIWTLVILWVNPAEAGWIGLLLFFLALFLAVASTAALVGYGIRRLLQPRRLSAYRVRPSLRQGIFLGLFMDFLLYLQLNRLLRWWIALIIVVLFLSVELGFLSYDKRTGQYREAAEERT